MSECKGHNEHIVMVQQMMCEDCGVTELDEANDRIDELEATIEFLKMELAKEALLKVADMAKLQDQLAELEAQLAAQETEG